MIHKCYTNAYKLVFAVTRSVSPLVLLVLIRSRYELAVVLVNPFLVTYVDPIQVWEAEVEGGQRWCELW